MCHRENKNVEQKIVGYFLFLFILSGYNSFNIYNTIGKSVAEKIKMWVVQK